MTNSKKIQIWIAIIIALLVVAGFFFYTLDSTGTMIDNNSSNNSQAQELIVKDLVEGTGAEAVNGKTVTVHYRGTLVDGTQFDASYDRGEPFSFKLGTGYVIPGWDMGLLGMKEGGKRMLTVPAHLGYGDQPNGMIPANSTLIFEVELLKVE